MMRFESQTISFLFETVDKVGAHLVANTYQNLVNHYSPVFYTLVSIYLGFCFIQMKRGHTSFNDFPIIVLRTVVILTFALNYHYFCLYLYDFFTNEPLNVCKAITIKGGAVTPLSVSHALDNFLNTGQQQAVKLFNMGSWNNLTYFVFGIIVFILVLVTTGIAAAVIVLAKCGSTILLALSPLFIFFALFDATKGLFDSYIRQLITYALMPIMTSAVLMILLSVSEIAFQTMDQHDLPNLISLLPLSLMCVIQMYLLLQVKNHAASLAGGFTLPAVGSTLRDGLKGFANAAKGTASLVAGMNRTMAGGHRRTHRH